MASGGWRTGMLLSTPQCPGWSPTKKTWLQTSVALGNPTWQEIDYIMSKPPEEKEKKPPPSKKKTKNKSREVGQGKTSAKERCCKWKQDLRCTVDSETTSLSSPPAFTCLAVPSPRGINWSLPASPMALLTPCRLLSPLLSILPCGL